jgi:hypothetical protein
VNDPNTSLFLLVNRFPQATTWLHGAEMVYASYGVVLFAVLLPTSWWLGLGRAVVGRAAYRDPPAHPPSFRSERHRRCYPVRPTPGGPGSAGRVVHRAGGRHGLELTTPGPQTIQ